MAPHERQTASKSFINLSAGRSTPTLVLTLNFIPSLMNKFTLRSIIFLLSLKSGIPYRSSPPTLSSISNTVTECPALFNTSAVDNPAGPEPMTAIFFPVLCVGICSTTCPISKAFSTIEHSFSRIVTASSCMASTHDFSHGAGQTLPVNSGKLFVADKRSYASSNLPR